MYNTIVVPLDGSPLAEHALQHAVGLAAALKSKLHLVRVYDIATTLTPGVMAAPAMDTGPVAGEIIEELAETEAKEADEYLAAQARRLQEGGANVEYSVQRGPTVDVLAALVEQLPAGLVVMSTRGQSGVKRFVFGSVADGLVRRVEIPVMIVPNTED
ncbi:MAG: hypothetical protein GEU28_12350 [Dehalococcoidia bacterium]|nr:hypothetical protein [Dehalococcoidia bacterium]